MKRTSGEKAFDIFNSGLLGFCGLITLFPFWNIIVTSFVGREEYYARNLILWPFKFDLSAYYYIFSTAWIKNGFKISILVTVIGTIYTMLLVCMAAFALNKKTLPGRKFFTTYFLITMYFSGGLVPYFLVVTKFLSMGDTLLALIITNGLNVWGFLVLRTFFKEIPDSLPESAALDGANDIQILFKIFLPLSLPALATLTLFNSVAFWNEWSRALYFINDDFKQPLQIILRRMVIDLNSSITQRSIMDKMYQQLVGGTDKTIFDLAVKSATVSVVTVPILCVYPFLQKYFAKGVLIGSVKG